MAQVWIEDNNFWHPWDFIWIALYGDELLNIPIIELDNDIRREIHTEVYEEIFK